MRTATPPIAVWSTSAAQIDLCVFTHADGRHPSARIPLVPSSPDRHGAVRWSLDDATLAPGQLYALAESRAPDRFLLDPRARAIGRLPLPPQQLDPLGVALADDFDWTGDRRPCTPWCDTVIYEAHVRGLTKLQPQLPPEMRGTFAGLGAPPVIDHFKALGVTAVELLPIHAHADEPALLHRGLTNYWGYNSLSFFAPDPRFGMTPGDPASVVRECQTMVRALHAAGIEVILDVVYNHTSEGEIDGPTQSLRGLDPARSYRWASADRYADWTGCGNTLDVSQPHVRALLLESLRHWATTFRVDGFRFDLASALDRAPAAAGSLFDDIRQDPTLAPLKLIAEPWDATGDGYRLGAFPGGVAEWNDRYRDDVRRFWRGDAGAAPAFATRLCGSADIFAGRAPQDSINAVTTHDGFTLLDLVSYAAKHNDANGEGNRDGAADNISSNGGAEGPTSDAAVIHTRTARQRALMVSTLLSLGTPMISGGDEFGRTQHGNNNAYCQDTPAAWTHWTNPTMADLIARALTLRRAHGVFRRRTHLSAADAEWFAADGAPLDAAAWHDPRLSLLVVRLKDAGEPDVLVIANADDAAAVVLPRDATWRVALSSGAARLDRVGDAVASDVCQVSAISIAVLEAAARPAMR